MDTSDETNINDDVINTAAESSSSDNYAEDEELTSRNQSQDDEAATKKDEEKKKEEEIDEISSDVGPSCSGTCAQTSVEQTTTKTIKNNSAKKRSHQQIELEFADIDSGSGGGMELRKIGSNLSICSSASSSSLQSINSAGSGSSTSSRTTYSSGDLAGVFSGTSLKSGASGNWSSSGDEYKRSVESMVEMGYRRELVERAMAATFNNPERAVEYLLSGISEINEEAFIVAVLSTDGDAPETIPDVTDVATPAVSVADAANTPDVDAPNAAGESDEIGAAAAAVYEAAAAAAVIDVGGASTERAQISNQLLVGEQEQGMNIDNVVDIPEQQHADSTANPQGDAQSDVNIDNQADPFIQVYNTPQFMRMRSLVYQNPDMLQEVLQQIGQTNPSLLRLISDHQDAFLNMLNQPFYGQSANQQFSRRMTPGRARQIIEMARISAGGDGAHVQIADTAPGASGDGPSGLQPTPAGSGDVSNSLSPMTTMQIVENRRATNDAAPYMRERASTANAGAAAAATSGPERSRYPVNDVRGYVADISQQQQANVPLVPPSPPIQQQQQQQQQQQPLANGGLRYMNRGAQPNSVAANNNRDGNNANQYHQLPRHLQYAQPWQQIRPQRPPYQRMRLNQQQVMANSVADNFINNYFEQRGIELTAADREAIERLRAMGFPENLIVEAFLACGRNVDLAVHYLIFSAHD